MRIAIIGGTGQMGRWFAILFKKKGHNVIISGRRYRKAARIAKELGISAAKTNRDAIGGADLIILSVLPPYLEGVLKEISPHLTNKQGVIDITSIKVVPVMLMHKHIRRSMILGTHPMFGPSAEAKGQNFILTPTNKPERSFAKKLGKMLSSYGFSVRITTPEKHDAAIGYILSLTHFIGFVTADTWKKLKIEQYMDTSSTSFKFLLGFAKSVVDSDPDLYSYIQMDVPTASKAESAFVKQSQMWVRMVGRKDRVRFKSRMDELSAYLERLEL
jgi:prephenate dehydrogenase